MSILRSGKACIVCKSGEVVAEISRVPDPSAGPPVYGPASRDQMKSQSSGFYCAYCGVKYQFITALVDIAPAKDKPPA